LVIQGWRHANNNFFTIGSSGRLTFESKTPHCASCLISPIQ
jgi:hypothetical protein